MSDLDHYYTFVRYNIWANRRAAEMLATLTEEKVQQPLLLLSHLLRAEQVWLGRIRGAEDATLSL